MPKIYIIKEYKARLTERKAHGDKSKEKPGTNFKTSSPSGVTQDMVNSPSEEL